MLKLIKKFWPILGLIIIGLFIIRNLALPGFPYTHDGHNHLARLANLKLTVKSGQFPPRWAPNLNDRFGYPVYNYSYYLAYLVALPLTVFLNVDISLKLALVFFYLLGGTGVFFWLKRYLRQPVAFLASVAYFSIPFQFVNLFIRGNSGEVAALGLLPWTFWAIDRFKVKKKSSFILASLIIALYWLSHNLTTITGLPIIAVYFLLKHKDIKTWFKVFSLTFCLGAFFYLPALLEQKYIIMNQTNSGTIYSEHFVYLKQLFTWVWPRFGFSIAGPNDTMSFSLGFVQVLILLIGVIIARKKIFKFPAWFFALSLLISIFMMLSSSQILYQYLPFIHLIQFPWRFLTVASFSLIALIGFTFQYLPTKKWSSWLIGLICLVLVAQTLDQAKAFENINYSENEYFAFSQTSTSADENRPIWFDREKALTLPALYAVNRINNGDPEIISWTASKHVYRFISDQEISIVERTAYFPGWQVTANNQPIEINYQDQQYPGVITFSLPPGDFTITTKFNQLTLIRRISNLISLLAFSWALYILIKHRHEYL